MKWLFVILLAISLSACGGEQTTQPSSIPTTVTSDKSEIVYFGSNWARMHDKEYGVTCWAYRDHLVCMTDAQLGREK